MIDYLIAIAPIFVLIILGHLLRRGGIPDVGFWNMNDRLVFWVLLPCLLFYKTATTEASLPTLGAFFAIGAAAVAAASAFSYVATRLIRFPTPVAITVVNGAGRHNVFIALAVAERLFGGEGLSTAALFAAVLIPATNLILVPLTVAMHPRPDEKGVFLPILRDLVRNPLLIAIALGFAANFMGWRDVPVLTETTRIVGAAALPIVLLCIGANIRIRVMQTSALPMVLTMVGKMVVYPLVVVIISQMMGLSETEMYVALIFGAAPVASSAYTMVRELGGDAPLMAAVVTTQTALSFLSLPFTIELVRWAMRSGMI